MVLSYLLAGFPPKQKAEDYEKDDCRYNDHRDNGSGSAVVLSIFIVVGRLLVSVVIIIVTRSIIIGITRLV